MTEGEGAKEGNPLPSSEDFQQRLDKLQKKEATQAKRKVRQYPLPPHVKEALDISQRRADPYGSNEGLAAKVRHALPTVDIKKTLARRKAEAEAEES